MCAMLITGAPGVGKTTIIKKLAVELKSRLIKADGFYTEEIRDGQNVRIGFDVVTLGGDRGILSRISEHSTKGTRRPTVGKYHVHVDCFEGIALKSISEESSLLIIDEIGTMELFSGNFEQRVKEITVGINNGTINIVATIPNRHSIKLVENLRTSRNTKIFEITKQNRNEIYDKIKESVLGMFHH